MSTGDIAIDTRASRPDGALIVLRADGAASCSGEQGGRHWQRHYPDADTLPDHRLLQEPQALGNQAARDT